MKKQYTHDCDSCTYLGTENLDYHGNHVFVTYDLYICMGDLSGPTPIARYGSDGPEYKSGMIFAQPGHPLNRAAELAVEKGLLVKSEHYNSKEIKERYKQVKK